MSCFSFIIKQWFGKTGFSFITTPTGNSNDDMFMSSLVNQRTPRVTLKKNNEAYLWRRKSFLLPNKFHLLSSCHLLLEIQHSDRQSPWVLHSGELRIVYYFLFLPTLNKQKKIRNIGEIFKTIWSYIFELILVMVCITPTLDVCLIYQLPWLFSPQSFLLIWEDGQECRHWHPLLQQAPALLCRFLDITKLGF